MPAQMIIVFFFFTGKNANGQPLTDELRQTYQNQYNAVLAHYKRLQVQYNMLRNGMVSQFISLDKAANLQENLQKCASTAS